jgi:hypothetical protein
MPSQLVEREAYDAFCHETRNALTCIKYAVRTLEKIIEDGDCYDNEELIICVTVLRKESERVMKAVDGSSRIWCDVARRLRELGIEGAAIADRK